MTNSIVSVRGLKKRFGPNEILHGLDFEIPAGRIYGPISRRIWASWTGRRAGRRCPSPRSGFLLLDPSPSS